MKYPIYISSSAFPSKNLETVLEIADRNDFCYVELGSGMEYSSDIPILIQKYRKRIKFLIHNYFPPPKIAFLLNLASRNQEVIERSISLCKSAINLSHDLGSEFYSVHSGFTFESDGAHLGSHNQIILKRIPIYTAYNNFIKHIKHLNEYAKKKRIKLAIENNVISKESLVDGKNVLNLGATLEDIENIFKDVDDDNLFLLLDLGHAKVNKNSLGVDTELLVNRLKKRILAVHISDNDGYHDNNQPITSSSLLQNYIRMLRDKYLILEIDHLTVTDIIKQINLIHQIIK